MGSDCQFDLDPVKAQTIRERHDPVTLSSLILLLSLLLCFGLSLQLLNRYPLREDEALYSYWALHLRYEDPWMLTVWPDKPPLYLWSQAALFSMLGATQATARLLNIGVTTATVALLAATSQRLWRNSGTVTALLYALNPFALSFAATAYTDPLLIFCGQLAFYLALRGRWIGAGIALGAAIMTKQQGLLYLPLLVAAVVIQPCFRLPLTTRINVWAKIKRLVALFIGVAIVVIPLLYGDSLRWDVAPSPWDLSVRNYGGLTMVSPMEWWVRARAWATLLWYVGGSWSAWSIYGFLVLFALGWDRWHYAGERVTRRWRVKESFPAARGTSGWMAVLLLLWSLGFLLLHLVTNIQIWDRYLLPLIPITVLLVSDAVVRPSVAGARSTMRLANGKAGHGIGGVVRREQQSSIIAANPIPLLLCVLLLLPTAWNAARGGLPIGGDHGAYSGLEEAISWLRAEEENLPAHQQLILYQHRLSWQLQFYLYREEQQGQIDVRWFANALTLADNAAKSTAQRRFLLQPTWQALPDFALHIATRNLKIIQQKRFGTMMLFELQNSPQQPCEWCFCQATSRSSTAQVSAAQASAAQAKPWKMVPGSTNPICAVGE